MGMPRQEDTVTYKRKLARRRKNGQRMQSLARRLDVHNISRDSNHVRKENCRCKEAVIKTQKIKCSECWLTSKQPPFMHPKNKPPTWRTTKRTTKAD